MFESVINHDCFTNTTIILMMNKIDLFQSKMDDLSINQLWTDFHQQGTWEDVYHAALQYFTDKLLALNKVKDRTIHVRYTNATDTETFKETMRSIEDVLLASHSFTLDPPVETL